MASSYPQGQQTGAYIQTTIIQDQQVLRTVDLKGEDFRNILMRLYEALGMHEKSINQRTAGFYPLTEFIDGNVFFPDPALSSTTSQKPDLRQEFVKVINYGPLPNTAQTSQPHGITIDANTTFTQIYATATNPVSPFEFVPIPYVSATDPNGTIEISVDGTNVYITTAEDWSAYTRCLVVLKYLKN
jgi:hypothetical protein